MTLYVWTLAAALTVAGALERQGTCPTYAAPRRVGSLSIRDLNEVSGIEASRRSRVLWIHEDSGNPAKIHAIRRSGKVIATISLDGATNTDWEDVALAGRTIWIGDIGDNKRARSGLRAYWFREPAPTTRTVDPKVLSLHYEDSHHDAEAMVVDARHHALFVITKEPSSGRGHVYRASLAKVRDGSSRVLRRIGSVPIGTVTAADFTPQGLLVKNYDRGALFRWTDAHTVRGAIRRSPCDVPVGGGESVTFRGADRRLYGVPEARGAPVWSAAAN